MLQTSKRTQNIVEYCIPFVRRTDVFRIFEPLRASTWQSEEQTYYGTPLYFTCPCFPHGVARSDSREDNSICMNVEAKVKEQQKNVELSSKQCYGVFKD
uniref:Uncharacterized protein n=1 Tax=Meloidogyne hapla TaxID=6305 RepID=A0A1I8B838_MELHA